MNLRDLKTTIQQNIYFINRNNSEFEKEILQN